MKQFQAQTLTKILQTLNELPEWEQVPFEIETFERMATFKFEEDSIIDVLNGDLFEEWLFDTRVERDGTLTVWFEL